MQPDAEDAAVERDQKSPRNAALISRMRSADRDEGVNHNDRANAVVGPAIDELRELARLAPAPPRRRWFHR